MRRTASSAPTSRTSSAMDFRDPRPVSVAPLIPSPGMPLKDGVVIPCEPNPTPFASPRKWDISYPPKKS